MNLPNQLTLARLGLCAVFVFFLSVDWQYAATAALVVFLLASFTDWLDGELARRYDQVTDFGRLFDPLADKVLVSAALIGLTARGLAPMWMVVVIIAREFLITGLRTLAAVKQRILAAERLGKHKTITQMLVVIASLLWLVAGEWHWQSTPGGHWLRASLFWLYALTVLVTVVSGGGYFWKNRHVIDHSK